MKPSAPIIMGTDLAFTAVTSLIVFREKLYGGMVVDEHGNEC